MPLVTGALILDVLIIRAYVVISMAFFSLGDIIHRLEAKKYIFALIARSPRPLGYLAE